MILRIRARVDGASRSGVAASELALLLPLLLLMVLACADFGRFAYTLIAVTNATRAGAGHAIMNPYVAGGQGAWATEIQQKARDELAQQTGTVPNNLTVTTTVTIEQTNLRRIRVEATYANFQTLIAWPGVPSSIALRRAVVMRAIR